jgi:hypothetical protein
MSCDLCILQGPGVESNVAIAHRSKFSLWRIFQSEGFELPYLPMRSFNSGSVFESFLYRGLVDDPRYCEYRNITRPCSESIYPTGSSNKRIARWLEGRSKLCIMMIFSGFLHLEKQDSASST